MKSLVRFTSVLLLAGTALAQQQPATPKSDTKPASPAARKADRAAAYYHYSLAHMYEEPTGVPTPSVAS